MPKILASRIAELQKSRTPYVHARVVLAEKPTSAKPGDEAIIFADGSMEGFVGGSCSDSTVRSQSVALLEEGNPILLRIALCLRLILSQENEPFTIHAFPVEL